MRTAEETGERLDWVIEYLRRRPCVDVLDSVFVDAYIETV